MKTPEVRKDWDAAFKRMTENKDDVLLDKNSLNIQSSWDDKEWTWEISVSSKAKKQH